MSSEKKQPEASWDCGKPALNDTQAAHLIEAVFGLLVSEIKPLPSYDDQNFHIKTTDVEKTTNVSDFVLKITNCEDSKHGDFIEMQTYVMMFLKDKGFPTAATVSTRDGKVMSLEAIDCGSERKEHMVRLLTYLPGIPVAKTAAGPDLLHEVGKLAAQIDKALEKCNHPKMKSLDRGNYIWSLANIPLLNQFVFAVDQKRPREVVEQTILEFKESILPKLGGFRKCINHGDLNDHNILVQKTSINQGDTSRGAISKTQDKYRISGILDFNDMSNGYYVFEVAIAIMYMMIESQDPLRVAGYVLAGFESIIPLTPEERGALFILVKCRFSQSLVMARYSVLQYPENEEYLMITAKTGWKHLLALADSGKEAIEKIWFDTAKAYNESRKM
ncbi:hydroxylysine kinase [Ambystoma mexicanum]|uniref:hydroxylysine kinase n=1 Tax=Ambystoma mexicanum TaxID=8296 RepID=UPI0037E7AF11